MAAKNDQTDDIPEDQTPDDDEQTEATPKATAKTAKTAEPVKRHGTSGTITVNHKGEVQ